MVLMSTTEAARRLGISDRRVRQLLSEGRIESIRVSGRWLIEEGDLHYERKPRGGYRPRRKCIEEEVGINEGIEVSRG